MSTTTTQRSSRRTPAPTPARRSPIVPLTIAALLIGAVVVVVLLLTSGVLNQSTSRDLATTQLDRPADLIDGRAVGAADAPVTINLWEDFQCPACGIFSRSTEPKLLEEYVATGKVRLVYHDMAFLGQESIDAAVAARAAEQLLGAGGFWKYHDLLFHNQDGENEGGFDRTVLADMAVSLGMDRDAFRAALDDPDLIAAVTTETQEGVAAGVSSTPTLFINGYQVTGAPPYQTLAEYIDGLLAAASPAPQ
ncbi:MAG: thioredoxin domain-containing protein [Chloroflexota bacterium]